MWHVLSKQSNLKLIFFNMKESQNFGRHLRTSSASLAKADEGKFLKVNQFQGAGLGVLTSGGDAQGMNAAIRAVVRTGIFFGCTVSFIREGYYGLVNGGNYITEATWESVSGILYRGGTQIGTARCPEFETRLGLLKAAKNLVTAKITNLVIIGGDGSLKGAAEIKDEWKSLLTELYKTNKITKEEMDKVGTLKVVGLVGSIDNDFSGTDMTIGTDSALHRIVESLDIIVTTAHAHQRVIIVEVMGRNCGYLAIVAAHAAEADFMFIPEQPPPKDWQKLLCDKIQRSRKEGQRINMIIIAEGATDLNRKPLSSKDVKKCIDDNLTLDCRIVVIGHIQRGGMPSAFDRILGTRMGAEAVMTLLSSTPEETPYIIAIDGNYPMKIPLMDGVKRTRDVAKALKNKQWEEAVRLRGKYFERNLRVYDFRSVKEVPKIDAAQEFRLGVMHAGSPACGMNAAVHAFTRNCYNRGCVPYGISNSIEGLIKGNFKKIKWNDVTGWTSHGGANLGTTKVSRVFLRSKLDVVASKLRENQIKGLLIIGGYSAFTTALILEEMRKKYNEFRIPILVIPSNITNNVPGTEFTLGCDTALNTITNICDYLRKSATATGKRVFIIEIITKRCGYLPTAAGLAAGSDRTYIKEEPFTVTDVQHDVQNLIVKMSRGLRYGLILNNMHSNPFYTTNFLYRLYSQEGGDHFSVRVNYPGHMQQGVSPTAYDRNFGTVAGYRSVGWFVEKLITCTDKYGNLTCTTPDSVAVLGIRKRNYVYTPVTELIKETDLEERSLKEKWWLRFRPLLRVLSQHKSTIDDPGHGLHNYAKYRDVYDY